MQSPTNSVQAHWRTSPILVRTAPFLAFVALTALQGQFGESSRYWIYAAKTGIGAVFVWSVWPWIQEMRWKFSVEAVLVGVVVFGLGVLAVGFWHFEGKDY